MGKRVDKNGQAFPRYKENPYLKGVVETSQTRLKPTYANATNPDEQMMIINGSGEFKSTAALVFGKKVEKNEFLKIYTEGVAAILSLNSAGKKVFLLICNELYGRENAGKTLITLNWYALDEKTQKAISKTTFNRGIKECLQLDVIRQYEVPFQYWINAKFIFNGDRLSIIHDFRLKEEQKEKQATPVTPTDAS